MAKNWAVVIGINSYSFTAPLNYAQRDAELFQAFLLNEAKFDKVLLFSPDAADPKLRPTRNALLRMLRQVEQANLTDGDNLWFYFSGHGMLDRLGHDYLMPADGDPEDIANTAISIDVVTERLKLCGADNVVMILDACRNVGRKGVGLTNETAEQARQKGIISIFSCSPYEPSYEVAKLQQGTFTYGLLEGLGIRGRCATVERLDAYLKQRVPELNRQYGLPRQTPYVIAEPLAKAHLILLPQHATLTDIATMKVDAYRAQNQKDWQLAERLWIRVLAAASGSDTDAIRELQQIAVEKGRQSPSAGESASSQNSERSPHTSRSTRTPVSPKAPVFTSPPAPTPKKTPSRQQRVKVERSQPLLSRRRVMQMAGVAGGGGLVLLLGRVVPWRSREIELPPEAVEGSRVEFNVVTVNARGGVVTVDRQQAEFYREDLGDGIVLEMMSIPGGEFMMGQTEEEKAELIRLVGEEDYQEYYADELPRDSVTVPPFFMGKYPVTQAQWRAVAALPKVERDLDPDPAGFKGDNRPVERVSWYEAVEFCQRLSQQTGREYRLPSEAEWEYACRAGTTTPFHFGETITTDLANCNGNDTYAAAPKGIYREETTEVGSFKVANAFGLYDMHGNVWEWCADHWHENYEGAPNDGSIWLSSDESALCLLRGGSWNNSSRVCRSAYRGRDSPVNSYRFVGFRVACGVARTS